MRQSFNHRIILLAGTALALSVGIAQAQVPAPPTPNAPPVMRATLSTNPAATTNEVTRLVMQIRGHEIEIVVRNGVPTYRIDGEWQGKDKFRSTADSGFIFDGPDGQPLLTLTAQQAADMGLTQRADIPRQRATGTPIPAMPGQVRITTAQELAKDARGGILRADETEVALELDGGIVVSLERPRDGKPWGIRDYKLDGKSMSANAYRITPEHIDLLDGEGNLVSKIKVADLDRVRAAGPTSLGTSTLSEYFMFMPRRAFLGITMTAVPESLAAQLGIDRDSAVLIGSVTPGQAAEEAGLKPQDVLLWIGKEDSSATFETVRNVLSARSPGDAIELGVIRAGKPMRVKATLRGSAYGLQEMIEQPEALNTDPVKARLNEMLLALESEQKAIIEDAKQREEQLMQIIWESTSLRGREAEQLARQIYEVSSQVGELIGRSRSIESQIHQLLSERQRSSPRPPLPPQTFLHGNAALRRSVTPVPTQPSAVMLSDGTVSWLMPPSEQGQSLALIALELQDQKRQLQRVERSRSEREAAIEQRLERIERLLEELAARQR